MPILWLKGNIILDLCVIMLVTFQVTITEYLTEIMRRSHGSLMVWGTRSIMSGKHCFGSYNFLSPSLQWILNLWKRECDTDISFRAEPLTIPQALHLTDCGSLHCHHLLQKGTLLKTFQGLFSPELYISPYSSNKPVPKANKPHNWVYFSNNSTFWYQFPVLVSFLIAIV